MNIRQDREQLIDNVKQWIGLDEELKLLRKKGLCIFWGIIGTKLETFFLSAGKIITSRVKFKHFTLYNCIFKTLSEIKSFNFFKSR